MTDKILNAIIQRASIQIDRDCFVTVYLECKRGDGWHQSFGGHVIGADPTVKAGELGVPNIGGSWLWNVMRVAGVEKWADVPGKAIRVRVGDGFSGIIEAIGHIVDDDKWFDPKAEYERLKGGAA
jgi:hypothetical protein